MQQFSSLLYWRLFTAQHVSGAFPPIIRSLMTAVAASGLTFVSWWQSCCVSVRACGPTTNTAESVLTFQKKLPRSYMFRICWHLFRRQNIHIHYCTNDRPCTFILIFQEVSWKNNLVICCILRFYGKVNKKKWILNFKVFSSQNTPWWDMKFHGLESLECNFTLPMEKQVTVTYEWHHEIIWNSLSSHLENMEFDDKNLVPWTWYRHPYWSCVSDAPQKLFNYYQILWNRNFGRP
jgi:hypothetical protein